MYAIVRSGGKQHRVIQGERLKVARLDGDVGSEVLIDDVLMIGGGDAPSLGTPRVDGAKVTAKIWRQERGSKIRVFKKRRRKGSKRLIGHRQAFTELEILGIEA